jgi:hypothetical protein
LRQDEESQEKTEKREEILEKNEKKGKLEGMSEYLAWNLRVWFGELWSEFE